MPLAEFIRFVPRLHERTFPLRSRCRPRFARLVPLFPVVGIAAPASRLSQNFFKLHDFSFSYTRPKCCRAAE